MKILRTSPEAVEAAAEDVGVAVSFEVLAQSRGGGQSLSVKVSPGEDPERWRRISRNPWEGKDRKVHAVCWHGFRDFYRELYKRTPEARVRSALANYEGREHFEETYDGTAYHNIGSQVYPLYVCEACTCKDSGQPY